MKVGSSMSENRQDCEDRGNSTGRSLNWQYPKTWRYQRFQINPWSIKSDPVNRVNSNRESVEGLEILVLHPVWLSLRHFGKKNERESPKKTFHCDWWAYSTVGTSCAFVCARCSSNVLVPFGLYCTVNWQKILGEDIEQIAWDWESNPGQLSGGLQPRHTYRNLCNVSTTLQSSTDLCW